MRRGRQFGFCIMGAIDRLLRIACHLTKTKHPDAAFFAAALDQALAGERLEAALGLHGGWRRQYLHERRNSALAALAVCFPALSTRGQAIAIYAAAQRYAAAGWSRNHATGHRPDGRDGYLHDLLELGEIPSCAHLRRILSVAQNGSGNAQFLSQHSLA